MDKLDIYNDSAIILESKIPKKIISWITILIVLTLLFICFSFVPFNKYKKLKGYINIVEDTSFIILKINKSDFPIDNNNQLYIKDKKYNYKIVNILEDKLIVKSNLDKNLKIQNNIVEVNLLKNRTTLYKIIKEKIKKGLGI